MCDTAAEAASSWKTDESDASNFGAPELKTSCVTSEIPKIPLTITVL